MKKICLSLGLVLAGMITFLSFGPSALADGPVDVCAGGTTPPSEWDLEDGKCKENVLGSSPDNPNPAGTATFKNEGPGNVVVTSPGAAPLELSPGESGHMQIGAGQKVDVCDKTDTNGSGGSGLGSKGKIWWTPNCGPSHNARHYAGPPNSTGGAPGSQ